MGAALPFVAAASIGASALGSISQGYAQSASDKANAQIAANNATIAKQNATFAGEEGEQQAGVQGQKTRQTAGAQRAGMGASGVDVNTGSNANVQASQAMLGQLDMMNIRANAARQAYGFDTQAVNFENQSSIDRSAAHNAIAGGYISGATKAATMAAGAEQSGMFSGGGAALPDTSLLNSTPVDPYSSYVSNSALNSGGGFMVD